jgi:hypothetical protein
MKSLFFWLINTPFSDPNWGDPMVLLVPSTMLPQKVPNNSRGRDSRVEVQGQPRTLSQTHPGCDDPPIYSGGGGRKIWVQGIQVQVREFNPQYHSPKKVPQWISLCDPSWVCLPLPLVSQYLGTGSRTLGPGCGLFWKIGLRFLHLPIGRLVWNAQYLQRTHDLVVKNHPRVPKIGIRFYTCVKNIESMRTWLWWYSLWDPISTQKPGVLMHIYASSTWECG